MPLARTACAMNPCRVGSATFCSMAKVHNITCGQQSCQLGYSPIHHRKDISSLNDQPFRPDHSYHLSSSHCTEEHIQAPSSGSSIHITWPLLVVKQKLCYIATAECWWLCNSYFLSTKVLFFCFLLAVVVSVS